MGEYIVYVIVKFINIPAVSALSSAVCALNYRPKKFKQKSEHKKA